MKELARNIGEALLRVRLSYYFIFFVTFFIGLLMIVPKVKLEGAVLTLFSVNSFLFGFYFAPILNSQKQRVEELGKSIRTQSVALFKVLIKTRKISDRKSHDEIQGMISAYVKAAIEEKRAGGGEREYDKMIGVLVHYNRKNKDIDQIDGVLDALAENQINRTNFDMLMGGRVYNNEWYVLLTLFCVTLSLPMIVDFHSNWIVHLMAALLCASLCLLLVTLLKMTTLSHKKAKKIWDPFKNLLESDFRQIDKGED